MRILIDPAWRALVEPLPDKDKADLFMCILDYPNRNQDSGVWRYIKQELDEMAEKYRAKCERMQQNGLMRWANKHTKSDVIEESGKVNIINKHNNVKVSESSSAAEPVEKPVDNFLISEKFSIDGLCALMPKLEKFLQVYPQSVIDRAQKTLIKKRSGQWLSLGQVLDWIEQENIFYQQNQRGKL